MSTAYLISIAVAVLALVLLAVVLVRTVAELRRARVVVTELLGDQADRAGLLRARTAGLRVGFAELRSRGARDARPVPAPAQPTIN